MPLAGSPACALSATAKANLRTGLEIEASKSGVTQASAQPRHLAWLAPLFSVPANGTSELFLAGGTDGRLMLHVPNVEPAIDPPGSRQ